MMKNVDTFREKTGRRIRRSRKKKRRGRKRRTESCGWRIVSVFVCPRSETLQGAYSLQLLQLPVTRN
jgi:G:T-mismatch repair DNA endonuclease (very short patch repair protein)